MSEHRIFVRTDDGTEIECTWEPGAKFVITVDDRSPIADSSAGTAKQAEAVSPESPASTPAPEVSTQLEHLRPNDLALGATE